MNDVRQPETDDTDDDDTDDSDLICFAIMIKQQYSYTTIRKSIE
jgi:hypothetical protein